MMVKKIPFVPKGTNSQADALPAVTTFRIRTTSD